MKFALRGGWVLVAALALMIGGVAWSADLYVSPEGTPEGDGSKEKPLDVFTALSKSSPAKPGDTIYLMAGTYDGKMRGIERVPFELAVSGAAGQPVRIMPAPGASAHLNGVVALTSSYAEYRDLDIGDLLWDPFGKVHKAPTALNATGGAGAKVINCNIFGGAMGTGLWSTAVDLEIYGCLVHDFGYLDLAGRGHGHAFYTQNERGTKVIAGNIAWRGCGWNVHVYTQGGQINGFDVIDNICYIAGAYQPGQTMDNYLISGYPPADNICLIGNVGYQPTDVQAWRPNARLGNFKPALNGTGVVRDNYFMGAFYGLSLGNWKKVAVTGNTIWSTGVYVEINSAPTGSGIGAQENKPALAGYHLANNTYIDDGRAQAFYYGNKENKGENELITFKEWQALGLDKGSRVVAGKDGRPTGAKVFIFPNKYEPSRANVGIFDWDGHKTLGVDLSRILKPGQKYRVYNCLDIRTTLSCAVPVLMATYDGKEVALPLRHAPISPDFDAFLILPEE